MEIEGFRQVPATHPHLGQMFIAGKGMSLPQAPYLGLAKVPGQSLLIHWAWSSLFVRGATLG